MSGWPDNELLLGRLRDWLDATRDEAGQVSAPGVVEVEGIQEIGLLRLVEEFTALRQEVKLQTKSSRNLQQQAEALLGGLKETLQKVDSLPAFEPDQTQKALMPWLEALADLDDMLWRAQSELEQNAQRMHQSLAERINGALSRGRASLPAWRRWAAGSSVLLPAEELRQALDPWLQSWADGYRLLRSRLARHMQRLGLERIECLGRPLDPHLMTAVQVAAEASQPPDTVVAEIRGGYTWHGEVVRFAEVCVAGRGSEPTHTS